MRAGLVGKVLGEPEELAVVHDRLTECQQIAVRATSRGGHRRDVSSRLPLRPSIGDNPSMSEVSPGRAEILQRVGPRFASTELAVKWFETEPLPGFGTATARQLVDAGRGQEVLDYIAAVDAGIHS